jgi:hypothetical protein
MKTAMWKLNMLLMALALVMILGAFAEGTIGLGGFVLFELAAGFAVRYSCAQMQRCEAEQAARRVRRATAHTVQRTATQKQPQKQRTTHTQKPLRVA